MTPPFAGILTDTLSGAVAVLAGFTALFGGIAHYVAVLGRQSDDGVERATGFGFFLGLAIGCLVLLLDALT